MKQVIRQYLASLRERDELDAVLPDLLSEMGLNVLSRPGRGTRQHGVDVAAVGHLDKDENEKLYLFSVKSGDLTRSTWNGASPQALRPSLHEILDAYIQHHLLPEHADKPIAICLCFGGEIKETVRTDVTGFISAHSSERIEFQEWNGDRLADMIQTHLLKEELLPPDARTFLRKAIALVDEPAASHRYFTHLINALHNQLTTSRWDDDTAIRSLRQISISLWILFSWARDADNFESAYLSSERALLTSWEIAKRYSDSDNQKAASAMDAFRSQIHTYWFVTYSYLINKIFPHTNKKHALSVAVNSSTGIDTNLRLFDLLGRMALSGLWAIWMISDRTDKTGETDKPHELQIIETAVVSIREIVSSNPVLYLPVQDESVIDISLACLLLLRVNPPQSEFVSEWLSILSTRAINSLHRDGMYPCVVNEYSDLLEHPVKGDSEYFERVTDASVLYPYCAFISYIIGDVSTYQTIARIQSDYLAHSNFQLFYYDQNSEECIYRGDPRHGLVFSDIDLRRDMEKFGKEVFDECDVAVDFNELTAVSHDIWPLVLVASRHYRWPVPLNFWKGVEVDAGRGLATSHNQDDTSSG